MQAVPDGFRELRHFLSEMRVITGDNRIRGGPLINCHALVLTNIRRTALSLGRAASQQAKRQNHNP